MCYIWCQISYFLFTSYKFTFTARRRRRLRGLRGNYKFKTSPTSFPGSLSSAFLGRWKKDRGCGRSRDSLQNRRISGTESETLYASRKLRSCTNRVSFSYPLIRLFCRLVSWHKRFHGGRVNEQFSFFQRPREKEKREPGNEFEPFLFLYYTISTGVWSLKGNSIKHWSKRYKLKGDHGSFSFLVSLVFFDSYSKSWS